MSDRSDREELYSMIGEVHAFACGAETEHLLIQVLIGHAVEAAISVAVADWDELGDQEIAERLKQRIEEMLLTEVAKINGT